MEVMSVYLDLQKAEPKKKGQKTVWKLESEAFKEPLQLQIGYNDKELDEFKQMVKELKTDLNNKDSAIYELEAKLDAAFRLITDLQEDLKKRKEAELLLDQALVSQKNEIKELYKVIADQKTAIETLSGTMLKQQEETKLIQQKLTKQPRVFSDKTFISWHESCGLAVLEIPSGEYLVLAKYVLLEHNEYVKNENDVIFQKVTVSNNVYVPMYQLVGWTELDVPTATIYRDLVLIPC